MNICLVFKMKILMKNGRVCCHQYFQLEGVVTKRKEWRQSSKRLRQKDLMDHFFTHDAKAVFQNWNIFMTKLMYEDTISTNQPFIEIFNL